MMKSLFTSSALLASAASALDVFPLLCLSQPPMMLVAGRTHVAAEIGNSLQRCEAVLQFSDPNFLPITFEFNSPPCKGREKASFLTPPGAPNGEAYLLWQCAGQGPSCTQAIISNGTGDVSIELQQNGTVRCSHSSVWNQTSASVTTTAAAGNKSAVWKMAPVTAATTDIPAGSTTLSATTSPTNVRAGADSKGTTSAQGFPQVSGSACRRSSSIATVLAVFMVTQTVTTLVTSTLASPKSRRDA